MQRIIPSDESQGYTAFVVEQVEAWKKRGVRFYFNRGWGDAEFLCSAFLNGAMYCDVYSHSRRHALELCIAKIVAGQLQGLVIDPPPSLAIETGAF